MFTTQTSADAGPYDVTREQYFADRERVSHHMLLDFGRSVPYFHGRYILGTIPAPEPSPQMKLGSAFDCLVLEPRVFYRGYSVAPIGIDRRTKAGKQAWEEFVEEAEGREIITAADGSLLVAMREGLLANPHARRALEAEGRVQQPIRWTCPETGLPRRGLPDKVLANGLIVDLKTAADLSPDAWSRDCYRYGYHLQMATYLEGCWAALGADGPGIFIAVSKEPPHECLVTELDPEALALGRRENRRLLGELAARHASGDWSSRHHGRIETTYLPRYAYSQGETS